MAYTLNTKVPWEKTMRELADCMDKWRVQSWYVTPASPGRNGANGRRVELYYTTRQGVPVKLTMDKQDSSRDNLRVLYLAVNAMRLNELRGIADVMQSAYAQTTALQARQATTTGTGPYAVLHVTPGASWEVIEAAYKAQARKLHPDAPGGSKEAMQRLNEAMAALRRERAKA